jgi:hypothetical protein
MVAVCRATTIRMCPHGLELRSCLSSPGQKTRVPIDGASPLNSCQDLEDSFFNNCKENI